VPPRLPDLRRLPDVVESLAAVVPRAFALLDSAEELLRRAHRLVDDIDATRAAADAVVVRTAGTVASVEPTLARVQGMVDTFGPVLDDIGPSAERLVPILQRISETTSPEEIQALVELIDHLPMLVGKLEADIVPILEDMKNVGPDIHALLDTATDLAAMLEKVPGLNRRRRADER
jgi:ABC-type transporter Mla subunit MlaD